MEETRPILISPEEARKVLGIGRNLIYDLLKEKDFPCFRIKNKYYINREQLQAWADKQCGRVM